MYWTTSYSRVTHFCIGVLDVNNSRLRHGSGPGLGNTCSNERLEYPFHDPKVGDVSTPLTPTLCNTMDEHQRIEPQTKTLDVDHTEVD